MKLSVIVGTRNRAYAIRACLDSIAAAFAKAALVDGEIIVVDNGSTDRTLAVIENWKASCPFPVRVLLESKPGLSAARNSAMRTATGDLLVFTDDDCRLSENYVVELLRRDAADSDLVLRGGRVELADPEDLPISIKTHAVCERWHRKKRSARYENLGQTIVGCNLAMRREAAERIGPFDERFGPGARIPASEDTDWIFRAYLADIMIEYVPDMVVFHHHGRKRLAEGTKLFANYAIGNGAVYAKFLFKDPDLCRQFSWDLKASLKNFLLGKSNRFYVGRFAFSRQRWLGGCIWGAISYTYAVLVEGWKSITRFDRPSIGLKGAIR
jgi:glycosyltransferase involved in cell wall biosynthesis